MRSSVALGCGAVPYLLLLLCRRVLVQCQSVDSSDSTCSTFFTEVVGSAGNETSQDTFTCGDGTYVAGFNISYGWWIDGLQIFCSNGNASGWYGASESVGELFGDTGGGLVSMSSYYKIQGDHAYPCLITFFAYTGDEEGSSSGSELGPYGNPSTSSTSTWDTDSGEYTGTSDCGSDAYAIGFLLHYRTVGWIYGLGLQCRTITAACPAPDGLSIPDTLPPTPAPVQETPAPDTLPSTPAPVQEIPAPTKLTVELGGDCSEYDCVQDLCCSEDKICGATASFCRDGLCCRARDKSECVAGSNQCLIGEHVETYWYDTPLFIGTSTAVGFIVTLSGIYYATYRYFCGQETTDSQ